MRLFSIYLSNLIWRFQSFTIDILICLITEYCPYLSGTVTQCTVCILNYLYKICKKKFSIPKYICPEYFGEVDCVLIFHFISKYQFIYSPTEEQLDVFPLFHYYTIKNTCTSISLCSHTEMALLGSTVCLEPYQSFKFTFFNLIQTKVHSTDDKRSQRSSMELSYL